MRKLLIIKAVKQSLFKLFEEAERAWERGERERAVHYIKMLFDLVKKYRTRVPRPLKNRFCRKCFLLWNSETVKVVYDRKNHCFRVICRCGFKKRL